MRLALALLLAPALAFAHDGPHGCAPETVGVGPAAVAGDAATLPVAVPTLLCFGFTACPDVCPLDLSRNAAAVEVAEAHGMKATSLFVSVSPADTADMVASYVTNWPGTEGRTRDEALMAALWVMAAERAPEGGARAGAFNRSTLTYVVAPSVGVVQLLARDASPEAVADALVCVGRGAPAP